MPLPAGFPAFEPPPAKRRPPPDYTSRSTKLRLFAATAAVMLALFLIERGPHLFSFLASKPRPLVGAPLSQTYPSPTAPGRVVVVERSATTAEAPTPPPSPTPAPPSLSAILTGYNLGRAELARFTDGQPLTPAEVELLAQILARLPSLRDELNRAAQPLSVFNAVASAPAEHRGEVLTILGRARHVVKETLPVELADRFEFRDYYRVLVDLNGLGQIAALYTLRVPSAWPLNQLFEEPVAADALFLKLVEPDPHTPLLAFATDRLAWHPNKPNPALGIGPDQLALAKLGFDISLWDDVRASNHRPLEASDRAAFYELLAAIREGEAPANPSNREGEAPAEPGASNQLTTPDRPRPLANLLQHPQEFQGTLQIVTGTARRITRIDIEAPEIRQRLHLDHYYEIDLFLPLGDAKIRLGESPSGGLAPEFTSTFPATLVVRELPPGLAPAANLHEPITASAVFFKIWTYDSRYTARFSQLQPAPLFIAPTFSLAPAVAPTSWLPTFLITIPLTLCFAILLYILYQSTRPRRRNVAQPPPPNFSHLTRSELTNDK